MDAGIPLCHICEDQPVDRVFQCGHSMCVSCFLNWFMKCRQSKPAVHFSCTICRAKLEFLSRLNIFIAQVVATSKLTKLLSVGIVFVLFVSVLFKNDLYSIET